MTNELKKVKKTTSGVYFESIVSQYIDTAGKVEITAMPSQAEDELRSRYLQIMQRWSEVEKRDLDIKLQTFNEIRKDFIKNFIDEDNALSMLGDLSMTDVNRTDTIIRVEKKNYIITDEYQTIGRVPLSDIPLTDVISNGGSRLHAFIRRFGQFVVIIDVGSFFGIKCKARSDLSSPRQHSLPKSRRPLIFKSNETVILELGSVVAVLNPLPCNIMSSTCTGYSNFVGQCGHFICCINCADAWREREMSCPVCRGRFYGNESENTYAVCEFNK